MIPNVENAKLYQYFFLFGIRINSCDTALPDDIIGGLRYMPNAVKGGGFWDIEIANASIDPSPLYQQPPVNKVNGKCPSVTIRRPDGRNFIAYPGTSKNSVMPCDESIWSGVGPNPFTNKCCIYFDPQAKNEGGAAWIAPGQYLYNYRANFLGEPAFAPSQPVAAYRWAPSYPGETFNPSKVVKELPNYSLLIHRTWFKERLFYDSAGCNVIPSSNSLLRLASWAKGHLAVRTYPRNFQYTVMSKDDFIRGNINYKLQGTFWEKIFGK